jgi:broad specificity phosphatase PhoE
MQSYWAKQEGDDKLKWFDAHLTPVGIKQASTAAQFWVDQLSEGMPMPDSYYTSPLSRCLQTCYLTFSGLDLAPEKRFKPQVKEVADAEHVIQKYMLTTTSSCGKRLAAMHAIAVAL